MALMNTTPKWSTFTVLVLVLSIMGFFSAPTGVFAERAYHTHKSVDTIKKHSAPKPPRNYAGNTAMEEVDDIVELIIHPTTTIKSTKKRLQTIVCGKSSLQKIQRGLTLILDSLGRLPRPNAADF